MQILIMSRNLFRIPANGPQ